MRKPKIKVKHKIPMKQKLARTAARLAMDIPEATEDLLTSTDFQRFLRQKFSKYSVSDLKALVSKLKEAPW